MTQEVVVVLELFAADVTAEVLDEDLVDGSDVAFQRLRRGENIAALVTMELHASGKTSTGATVCVMCIFIPTIPTVLGIRVILVRIWIRRSIPLTNGSGSDSFLE